MEKSEKMIRLGIIILVSFTVFWAVYLIKNQFVLTGKNLRDGDELLKAEEVKIDENQRNYEKYLIKKISNEEPVAIFVSNSDNSIYSYSKNEGKKLILSADELQKYNDSNWYYNKLNLKGDSIFYTTKKGLYSISIKGEVQNILDFKLFSDFFDGVSFIPSEPIFLDDNSYIISLSSGDNGLLQPDRALIINGDAEQKTGTIVWEESDARGQLLLVNKKSFDGYVYVTKGVPKGCGVWLDFLLDPNDFSKHSADNEPGLFEYGKEVVSPDFKYVAKMIEHPDGHPRGDMCYSGYSVGIVAIFDKDEGIWDLEKDPSYDFSPLGWTSDSKYFIYYRTKLSSESDFVVSTEYAIFSMETGEKFVEKDKEGVADRLNRLYGTDLYEVFISSKSDIPEFDTDHFVGFVGASEFFRIF